MSPYPTVDAVTTAHHRASPKVTFASKIRYITAHTRISTRYDMISVRGELASQTTPR
jgi:hypothetical protein